MFRSKNNTRAVVAALALASAAPALVKAADDTAAPDTAAAGDATADDLAADASPSAASDTDTTAAAKGEASAQPSSEVVISAERLNEARASIETQTGASTYTIDSAAIQAIPGGGENAPLNQVILQAPDVTQDSFGQLHVRGEHNGLQYRLNGIILPEGISVFSQTLDPHLVQSLSLLTGALPAEFGLRTAGIVDLTTKSGVFDPYASLSLYGGSHNTIYPSFFAGGSSGAFNYLVTGDFERNNLGIESPYNTITPIHDETKQYHGFGYFEYIIDPDNRVSAVLGTSHAEFQIPQVPGGQPAGLDGVTGLGPCGSGTTFYAPPCAGTDLQVLTVNGQYAYPTEKLNQNQTEITQYAVVSFQHVQGELSMQTSLSGRYTSLTYFPDELGELLYNGIAPSAFKRDEAYSWQTDAEYDLNESHMVRFGFYIQHDNSHSRTGSQVLPVDPNTGMQTMDVPLIINDSSSQIQNIQSVYLQDEWKLLSTLTANYGLRYDHLSAYATGHQVEPRVNLVWKPLEGTTVHGGYSRYFSPPPFELIANESVNKYANTTGAQPGPPGNVPPAEIANYYDVGVQQKFTPDLTVGIDSFYKQSSHLIDEGQFGAPIILTPFNYRYGQQYGVELTLSYTTGPFALYINAATQRVRGKGIETAQFNFDPRDLEYTTNHYISLDHEQQYGGSAGASYLWNDTRFSVDMLFASGLREDLTVATPVVLADGQTTTNIPNGAHLPYYRQVNMSIAHTFHGLLPWGTAKNAPTVRFDVINVFDTAYEIRNGTGIGVGAPQWGARRGFFGGITFPL